MKKMKNQHGDVLLESVEVIPSEAKKVKANKGFVIEKGEGVHTHTLVEGDFEVYQISDTMYIKVKKDTVLDHEEHGKQVLKPGIYKKNIEREYSYEDNEERRVLD